jgi:enoyl-CoA hydratase/carnithine racemase
MDPVIVHVENAVAWVKLNRPDQLNALSPEVISGLVTALDTIERDEGVRVVVITGEGRAFSAGGDL